MQTKQPTCMNYQHDRITTMKREVTLEQDEAPTRDETVILSHYDVHYFNDFQKKIGEFGGRANKFMFEKHVLAAGTVLDFGCGGGFLLNNPNCSEKIGVRVNPGTREF